MFSKLICFIIRKNVFTNTIWEVIRMAIEPKLLESVATHAKPIIGKAILCMGWTILK